jgi:hypothetical protein
VSVINWDNKPEWADVWIEDLAPECAGDWGGWHRETDMKYIDKDDCYWFKIGTDRDIKVHHPPSERERLQNKPKWSDAPEWALSLGQDRDGKWHWFPHYNEDDKDEHEWMMQTAGRFSDYE